MDELTQKLPAEFGSFYLFDCIGRGGMAEIFLAKTFTGLGIERLAAIKRILPSFSNDDSFGEMLIQEAKLCAQLSHANIVQTYDLGKTDGQFYIAMEYVEGFDLNRLLGMIARARLALPFQFALYIIVETLRGLDYAHRMNDEEGNPVGIIHRDVSPTNVLISTEGEVKVCDFGIAKAVMRDCEMDNLDDTHLKGKIAYMAPEHIEGENVDCRADLYAAGILLWELLSGKRLFKPRDPVETIRKAKQAPIPAIVDRGFPEYEMINAIAMKALSRDPDKRFQSGQQFIRALREYMHLAQLIVSQLKFSEFLREHFGANLQELRRERERNLAELVQFEKALEAGQMEEPSEIRERDNRAEAILASFAHVDDIEETDSKISLSNLNIRDSSPSHPELHRSELQPSPAAASTPQAQNIPKSDPQGNEPKQNEGHGTSRKTPPSGKQDLQKRSAIPERKMRPTTSEGKMEKGSLELLWIVLGVLALVAMAIVLFLSTNSTN